MHKYNSPVRALRASGSNVRCRTKPTLPSSVSLVLAMIVAFGAGYAGAVEVSAARPAGQRTYRVPGGEMEPTLRIGQIVDLEAPSSRSRPYVGEIVLFHPPSGWAQELCGPVPHIIRPGGRACSYAQPRRSGAEIIGRIVAAPGDVLSIQRGHVIRNGMAERDRYIRPCQPRTAIECNYPTPIRVPRGRWFVVGDNRGESDDSREFGPVAASWIIDRISLH
jgi:signal peptidase I